MQKNRKTTDAPEPSTVGSDFLDIFWEESWTYIKTVVNVAQDPVLILDSDFRVMAANESFYQLFKTEKKDTEKKLVYELGNGQWNIPALQKLLEDILPKNIFFKGFEVSQEFPLIGHKTMILSGRQIHVEKDTTFPPIILLAMEDISEMMHIAEMLARHTKQLETKTGERIEKLEIYIKKLEEKVSRLKKAL